MEDKDYEELYEFILTPSHEFYYNEETFYGIYAFTTEENLPYSEEIYNSMTKKPAYTSTIVGKMQELTQGVNYRALAKLVYNDKYKYQYKCISISPIVPKDLEMSRQYLMTITTKSITDQLLAKYPTLIDDVALHGLKEIDYENIKGVKEKTWNRIREGIIKNYGLSEIMAFLQPAGVSQVMIEKLLAYEPNIEILKQKIKENPYVLTEVKGFGFKKVDHIAISLDSEMAGSRHRLVAYIKYYLTELGQNTGDTWEDIDKLKQEIRNNVPQCIDYVDDILSDGLFLKVDTENNRVGLERYARKEYDCLKKVYDLNKIDTSDTFKFDPKKVDRVIKQAEKQQGFNYTAEQLEIIKKSLNKNVILLTGKAGTGKTSIIRAVLNIYKAFDHKICACALAAKAAHRITEATGISGNTIHSVLGFQGNGFAHDMANPLDYDLVFLDEASMINVGLFNSLLRAIPLGSRIIICGDDAQLPPIGYGNVFSDLLKENKLEPLKLTKVLRQAEKSGITKDANIIRQGKNPITKLEPKIINGELHDMYYIFNQDREALRKMAISTYLNSVETDGVDEVAIIVPRKQNCINSVREINKIIQDYLIPKTVANITCGEIEFRVGAKVMQTAPNRTHNVINGAVGVVKDIYVEEKRREDGRVDKKDICEIVFTYPDGQIKDVKYTRSDLKDVELGYAASCHKFQGSNVKTVIGILDMTHYSLLDNCMLYTLMTRAKKRCLLLAEPKAFIKCINTNHGQRRTWLNLR